MKATGIVRRIDDLGRVVIPKEIRRTMRIREGDPLDNSLTPQEKFAIAVHSILKRYKEQARWISPRCYWIISRFSTPYCSIRFINSFLE